MAGCPQRGVGAFGVGVSQQHLPDSPVSVASIVSPLLHLFIPGGFSASGGTWGGRRLIPGGGTWCLQGYLPLHSEARGDVFSVILSPVLKLRLVLDHLMFPCLLLYGGGGGGGGAHVHARATLSRCSW